MQHGNACSVLLNTALTEMTLQHNNAMNNIKTGCDVKALAVSATVMRLTSKPVSHFSAISLLSSLVSFDFEAVAKLSYFYLFIDNLLQTRQNT